MSLVTATAPCCHGNFGCFKIKQKGSICFRILLTFSFSLSFGFTQKSSANSFIPNFTSIWNFSVIFETFLEINLELIEVLF